VPSLSEYVRNRRLQLGLTQSDIEQRYGVPQTYLSDIERGRTVRPSLAFRQRLAQALHVDPIDLLVFAGDLAVEELEGWARKAGFYRPDEGNWAERLIAELNQDGADTPRAQLAREIPWLLHREATFLREASRYLPTEAQTQRLQLRDDPTAFRDWRDTQDVMDVL
jgi:transcriptional regulator with XRE-family HTH domain